MLDSLDLKSLAEVIERNRRTARYRWLSLVALVIALTLIMFVLFVTPSPQEGRNCNCAAATTILTNLPFVGVFGAIAIFTLNQQPKRKRIKQYAAELIKLNVPSLTNQWLSLLGLFATGWSLFWLLGLVFLNANPFIALFLIIAPSIVVMLLVHWSTIPLSQGHYNEVFRRWTLIQKLPLLSSLRPSFDYGLAHLFAAHTHESEKVQLQMLAVSLNARIYESVALNNYASELFFQRRYQESKGLLELGILIQPEIPSSYESLAIWYLHQNQSPERASELCKFALDLPLPFLTANKKTSRAVGMATYSWSEARLGHVEKAHELLSNALTSADSKNVPYFALINYTAGETQIALKDIPAARQHFEQATRIDPQGRFGRMAQQKLDQLA